MKKQWRTVQPAHESDKFTVEEARAAWPKVDGEAAVVPGAPSGKKRWRTIQPAHVSDKITVEQAMEICRRIKAEKKRGTNRPRFSASTTPAMPRVEKAAATRVNLAADYERRSPTNSPSSADGEKLRE
jgi:hypothetical protein